MTTKRIIVLEETQRTLHLDSLAIIQSVLRRDGRRPRIITNRAAITATGAILTKATTTREPRRHLQPRSSIHLRTVAYIVSGLLQNLIFRSDAMNVNHISVKIVIGVMNFKRITKSVFAIGVMHFTVEIAMRWTSVTTVERSFVRLVVPF